MNEKTIAKFAVRIGDNAHKLAQKYIKLKPTYAPLKKKYDEAERILGNLRDEYDSIWNRGECENWPDMMADLEKECGKAEDVSCRLGDKVFELETELEEIEGALYCADQELR